MKKTWIAMLLGISVMLTAAGCASKPKETEKTTEKKTEVATEEAATQAPEEAAEALTEGAEAVTEAVEALTEASMGEAVEALTEGAEALTEAVEVLTEAPQEEAAEAVEALTEGAEALTEAVEALTEAPQEEAVEAVEELTEGAEALTEAVEALTEAPQEEAVEAVEALTEGAEALTEAAEAVTEVSETELVAEPVTEPATEKETKKWITLAIADRETEDETEAVESLTEAAEEPAETLTEAAEEVAEVLTEAIEEAEESLSEAAEEPVEALTETAEEETEEGDLLDMLLDAGTSLAEGIEEAVGPGSEFEKKYEELKENLGEKGEDLARKMDEVGTVLDEIREDAKEQLHETVDDLSQKKEQLSQYLWNKLSDVLSGDEVEELTEAVSESAETDSGDNAEKEVFSYVHDPRDNPKAMRDIVENPDAVYGFSPSPDSKRLKDYVDAIDWTDPDQVAQAKEQRKAYHESFSDLYRMIEEMLGEAKSVEEIARAVSQRRNELRLEAYADDPEGLELVKKSNLETYGYEEGPTADQLYEKYGSWQTVLEKALATNEGMDACLGLYDEYYDVYVSLSEVE